MKTKILTAVVLLMVFFACQEQAVEKKVSGFDQTTGDQITESEAERWITRFSKVQAASRIQSSGLNISAEQLSEIMKTENLVGVEFYHGLDEQGDRHVIAVPMDGSESWDGKYIVDANTNQKISADLGQKWSSEYKSKNPGQIFCHQFGSEIINEITSLSFFNDIELQHALNDDLVPQLILCVKDESQTSGRTTAGTTTVYYDKSNPR